ncbi:ral guanine nucleotide dissociation stimulator-like 1 [Alligator mississippiensis]|uniref:ral guanine nucleotide dissociation stimulator-like 1 n=1 Tax=Alligator mississippiensis TaxID=8496 RepID=UPI00287807FE|nr:ral guanine nucleotide dissociation stimulator-like 1 [Alligator mississippiensis]
MLLSRHGKLETLSCRGDESPDFSADSRAVLGNPIIFFLKTWLHFSPEDFKEPPKYHTLQKVIAHLNKNVPGCDVEMEAKHLLHQFQNEAENESKLYFFSSYHFIISETALKNCILGGKC